MQDKNVKIFLLLRTLFKKFKRKRKLQIYFLFLTIFVSAISELISLISFFPFLEILSNPNSAESLQITNLILKVFNISSQGELILIATIIFSN